MMEIITFFIVYYHVFFIGSTVVICIDYLFDLGIFTSLHEVLDKPVVTIFVLIEVCMVFAFFIATMSNSTLIMSALWIISVILLIAVLLTVIMFILHKLFDLEW